MMPASLKPYTWTTLRSSTLKRLVRGTQEYGIALQHRPPKQSHFGGHIKRLIGTVMGAVRLLPGTTMPNGSLMRLSGLNHVNLKGFTTVNSLTQGCFLPNHLDRILVFKDPEKDGLPEPIIACPFREFDLADRRLALRRHVNFTYQEKANIAMPSDASQRGKVAYLHENRYTESPSGAGEHVLPAHLA